MWITILQTLRHPAGRSRSVGRQTGSRPPPLATVVHLTGVTTMTLMDWSFDWVLNARFDTIDYLRTDVYNYVKKD